MNVANWVNALLNAHGPCLSGEAPVSATRIPFDVYLACALSGNRMTDTVAAEEAGVCGHFQPDGTCWISSPEHTAFTDFAGSVLRRVPGQDSAGFSRPNESAWNETLRASEQQGKKQVKGLSSLKRTLSESVLKGGIPEKATEFLYDGGLERVFATAIGVPSDSRRLDGSAARLVCPQTEGPKGGHASERPGVASTGDAAPPRLVLGVEGGKTIPLVSTETNPSISLKDSARQEERTIELASKDGNGAARGSHSKSAFIFPTVGDSRDATSPEQNRMQGPLEAKSLSREQFVQVAHATVADWGTPPEGLPGPSTDLDGVADRAGTALPLGEMLARADKASPAEDGGSLQPGEQLMKPGPQEIESHRTIAVHQEVAKVKADGLSLRVGTGSVVADPARPFPEQSDATLQMASAHVALGADGHTPDALFDLRATSGSSLRSSAEDPGAPQPLNSLQRAPAVEAISLDIVTETVSNEHTSGRETTTNSKQGVNPDGKQSHGSDGSQGLRLHGLVAPDDSTLPWVGLNVVRLAEEAKSLAQSGDPRTWNAGSSGGTEFRGEQGSNTSTWVLSGDRGTVMQQMQPSQAAPDDLAAGTRSLPTGGIALPGEADVAETSASEDTRGAHFENGRRAGLASTAETKGERSSLLRVVEKLTGTPGSLRVEKADAGSTPGLQGWSDRTRLSESPSEPAPVKSRGSAGNPGVSQPSETGVQPAERNSDRSDRLGGAQSEHGRTQDSAGAGASSPSSQGRPIVEATGESPSPSKSVPHGEPGHRASIHAVKEEGHSLQATGTSNLSGLSSPGRVHELTTHIANGVSSARTARDHLTDLVQNQLRPALRQLLDRQGESSVVVQLRPPELGRVRVEVKSRGREVAVKLEADVRTTHDVLRAQLPALEKALQDQGLQTSRLEVQLTDFRQPTVGDRPEQRWESSTPWNGGEDVGRRGHQRGQTEHDDGDQRDGWLA